MLLDQVQKQFLQRLAFLVLRQHHVRPRDLILRQTNGDLGLRHNGIILRHSTRFRWASGYCFGFTMASLRPRADVTSSLKIRGRGDDGTGETADKDVGDLTEQDFAAAAMYVEVDAADIGQNFVNFALARCETETNVPFLVKTA